MTPSEMIDTLGGTTAVAKLLNVKPPSVHAWRTGGIPDDKLIRLAPAIERATNGRVSRRDLRPDDWASIWPELASEPTADAPPEPPPTRKNVMELTIAPPPLHEKKETP